MICQGHTYLDQVEINVNMIDSSIFRITFDERCNCVKVWSNYFLELGILTNLAQKVTHTVTKI